MADSRNPLKTARAQSPIGKSLLKSKAIVQPKGAKDTAAIKAALKNLHTAKKFVGKSGAWKVARFTARGNLSQYYAIPTGKRKFYLGEGSWGKVFLAKQIDPLSGSPLPAMKKPVVAKIIHEYQTMDYASAVLTEAEANQLYYGQGMQTPDGRIILQSYHPGRELSNELTPHDPAKLNISELSFLDSMQIIQEILFSIQYAHSLGIAHADIKKENIKIAPRIKKTTSGSVAVFDVYPFDWGCAQRIAQDPHQLTPIKCFGTILHEPPEIIFLRRRCQKSDLYAAGIVIAELLNAHDPTHLKAKHLCELTEASAAELPDWAYILSNTPFDLTGLLKGAPLYIDPDLALLIKRFIGRMLSSTYLTRPDAYQSLQFFSALRDYCYACEFQLTDVVHRAEVVKGGLVHTNKKYVTELKEKIFVAANYSDTNFPSYTNLYSLIEIIKSEAYWKDKAVLHDAPDGIRKMRKRLSEIETSASPEEIFHELKIIADTKLHAPRGTLYLLFGVQTRDEATDKFYKLFANASNLEAFHSRPVL